MYIKKILKTLIICLLWMEFIIPINKFTTIRSNGGFSSQTVLNILYCGMIGKDTFSIASKPFEQGGVNLYYPTNIDFIMIKDIKIKIIKVDTRFLTVEVPSI